MNFFLFESILMSLAGAGFVESLPGKNVWH